MRRIDPRPDHALLLSIVRDRSLLRALPPASLAAALDAAHAARLLGWLVASIDGLGVPTSEPEWLDDRMISARAVIREYDRALRWETNRLRRAFHGSGIRWVLLKGAGYLAADLAPGKGRRVADIDILVAREALERAERHLAEQGWAFADLDAYDTRYYREWMHESPPMVHRDRGSVVDVHHAILPLTARLRPPTARLLERAVAAPDGSLVLCPAHMIAHAAAHLFHDGEIAGAIRDLVDLDTLLRAFGERSGFWDDLEHEAAALGLARPTFYAIRYAHQWLATPVPEAVARRLGSWAPHPAVLSVMDRLVERTLFGERGRISSAAALMLYVRSHWLRMPPLQLMRHLWHKLFISAR
jgi:hypothetical protein